MEEQKTIAGVEGFEIHDTVFIKITGHHYSWVYDQEIYGVVMKVSEKEMTVKQTDGQMFEYNIEKLEQEKNKDNPNLVTTIDKIAHQLYKEELQKAVDASFDKLVSQHEELLKKHNELLEWQKTYEKEISFFARLKRFFNTEK